MAFTLILIASLIIYFLASLKAPKPPKSKGKVSIYACGERVHSGNIRIAITLSKYLIYFIVLDSSVLLVMFISLIANPINVILPITYLAIILIAALILSSGD